MVMARCMDRDGTSGSVSRSGDKSNLGGAHERRVSTSGSCYWHLANIRKPQVVIRIISNSRYCQIGNRPTRRPTKLFIKSAPRNRRGANWEGSIERSRAPFNTIPSPFTTHSHAKPLAARLGLLPSLTPSVLIRKSMSVTVARATPRTVPAASGSFAQYSMVAVQ